MPVEMPDDESPELRPGSLIRVSYEGREFEVIVIDPDGLGKGQPSVGFGYRMAERNAGVPESTIRSWVREKPSGEELELPSGKAFGVREILAVDGNTYKVVEASDWFAIAVDLLVTPGRTGRGLRARLGDFISWFAVKGFYAEAYVAFKGVYTAKDSRATTVWLESRQLGIPVRNLYTDFLQAQGCTGFDYGNWTNYVYQGLFGMKKSEMVEVWDLVAGNPNIGRNYIPKAEGLDAVRYCEDMVVRMFVDDLEEAHNMAINLTRRRYLGGA
jgi:hypothetical protein